MSDTEIDIDTSKLTPANQNPWYILMTLYGEQEGDGIEGIKYMQNRRIWNSWMCQHLNEGELRGLISDFDAYGVVPWRDLQDDATKLFAQCWMQRNEKTNPIPDFPSPNEPVLLNNTAFGKRIFAENFLFLTSFRCYDSVFYETLSFNRSLFLQGTIFCNSIFFKNMELTEAKFLKRANLSENTYFRKAYFSASYFKEDVLFHNSHFKSNSYFNKVLFGDKESKHTGVGFIECVFDSSTYFINTRFRTYPYFDGTLIPENSIFSPKSECWPLQPNQGPVSARNSCALIRHALNKQGLPEDAHFFFRREMHFAGQIGGFWQRLPYKIYSWFSDYGYSIKRPTLALLMLWLIGSIGLALGLADLSSATAFNASILPASVVGIALSFSNLFPFFGFTGTYFEPGFLRELPAPLKVLSAAQTVLSLPLLFFLGLGLRTRFRMR